MGDPESEPYTMTEPQLDSLMLFMSHFTLGQLFAILSMPSYHGALPRLGLNRHLAVPVWAIDAVPFGVHALNARDEEICKKPITFLGRIRETP